MVSLLLIILIVLSSSALRVPVRYNDKYMGNLGRVGLHERTGEETPRIEEYIVQNNFSSSEECTRKCEGTAYGKRCYYRFYLENYATLTKACDYCTPNRTNSCQCVLADGVERSITTVNRMVPGPSIEVCKGDEVTVDVVNRLQAAEATIHWHGIRQRGSPYYDGVPYVTQCPITSGTTFRYIWQADAPGTHFWHSHSGFHKINGLSGSVIIRQESTTDPHSELYDYDLSEHVIFIQDWMHEDAVGRFPGRRFGVTGQWPDNFLINGKGLFGGSSVKVQLERFVISPGKRYRFRLVNAFASVCPVELLVQSHHLTVIATDGYPVSPVQVDSIISTSAERYDVVLNADQTPGCYWIQIKGHEACAIHKIHQLAILEYSSERNCSNLTIAPTFANSIVTQKVLNPLDSNCGAIRNDAICVSQLHHLESVDTKLFKRLPDMKIFLPFRFYFYNDRELFQPGTYKRFFGVPGLPHMAGLLDNISFVSPPVPLISQFNEIDPQTFCNGDQPMHDCGGICKCTHLIQVPLNSVVELILLDEVHRPGVNHPFHLHGFSFYVIGTGTMPNRNETISLKGAIEMDRSNLLQRQYNLPPAKDTITIPTNGYVILRFKADNPGFWLLHCHFLIHLLTGMAAVLQVGTLADLPPVPDNFTRCGNFWF